MRLEAVELRRISLSLVAPFETSFGVQTDRDVLLLKALTDRGEGWGECVAGEDPLYSPEYVDGAQQLLETVGAYVEQGYRRIKLKIRPGWDVEPVRAVRERFGNIPLQVDANTAYSLSDAEQLAKLDPFDLLLIEQPLPEEQVLAHAKLAK